MRTSKLLSRVTSSFLDRVEILDEQIELLVAATEGAMDGERDAEFALHEDREGIGAAAGVGRS